MKSLLRFGIRHSSRLILPLLLTLPAIAQIPNTLNLAIPAPPAGVQGGALLGSSVAMEGGFIVCTAPYDDIGGSDSGVAKVFSSTTGALLFVLPNPSPATEEYFGLFSVAISGTRVVVGVPFDDTGATDAGRAYVFDLSSGTPTLPVATLDNPSPAVDDYFGATVSISGTRIVVGAANDDTGATNAGSAYVYDLSSGTPTMPVMTLNNPGAAAFDYFATSVAISGTRIVIGAITDDTAGSDAGTAYVFDLGSGTPTVPVFTLLNPTPAGFDNFGYSVAISGTRLMVGAPLDNTGATDAGSAYAYDLASGTPTVPVATLGNPSPASFDSFGYAVAIAGTRVVVGASDDDAGANEAGSAYVYDLSSGTPSVPVATLGNPGPAAGDRFGYSVAVSGAQVVVSAPFDNTGAEDAGSAYLYDVSSGTPTVPVFALNDPGPASGDGFGSSVAVSGTRVVVGAYFEDTGAFDAGSVYVYDLAGGTPTVPVVTLHNPSPADFDHFGAAVSISGTRIVVGTPADSTGASEAGSTYVYDLSSGTPAVPIATLNNPSPAASDLFGYSVAISGTRIVVGALSDDTGASDAGSAYVYDLSSGTPTVPVNTLNNPGPAAFDNFGTSVAISGTRIVVGALADDTGATDAGSAYVYDLSSGTPTVPVNTLPNPSPASFDNFGTSVAISGMRLVVGALNDSTGAPGAGSAYVYDLASGTPTVPVATLNNPGPAAGELFGSSVTISGLLVVVGASYDSTSAPAAGSAYVYDLASGTPTVPVATLNNPGPAKNDLFGASVAIDGTTVTIGTPLDDTVMSDKGFTYIFGSSTPDIAVTQSGPLTDGAGSVPFGLVVLGTGSGPLTFTLSNPGTAALTSLSVTKDGAHATEFTMSALSGTSIPVGGGTMTFTVTFAPTAGGAKTAALHIASNVTGTKNPFDISLSGTALSFTTDTDSDGLSDASEFQLAALGYDWEVNQAALVTTLTSSLNGAGYFTPAQVQALNVSTPLIQRNATTGIFTLTLGVEKSTNLSTFNPFPMTAPQTLINGAGKLEFQFTVPDNAAFFQLRAE